ncbi:MULTISPECIES: hypothetical protein [Corynebacterium]|uniref:AMIN-like domain-containing (lipo)protein n=1 Tax=Corynebacterium TaxID=1716 RepID=UPI00191E8144|nr:MULTISPECIES: hypothetical protein [Corynebacterium]MCG7236483.1 hypothetical protein [Corynebacterium sp. ACRQP]MCG7288873.1 hypothetical protein [Corynebacterium sp. ACRPZ]MCG7294699.1 hypothetical protein [Corynebacterium sp. ACRPY]
MFKISGLSRAAFAGACVAVAAACGACGAVSDGAGNTLMGSISSPTTQAQPLGTADPAPKTQRPSVPSRLAVVGVRVGAHEGFDRVVVDLEGDGNPGWFVDYTSTPMQETVGQPLQVAGNFFLNINVDGTVYPFELGKDNNVPVTMAGDTGNVIDVISAGTYEGRSQIVVGLRSELPYSVQVLENPKRVVVDIVQK